MSMVKSVNPLQASVVDWGLTLHILRRSPCGETVMKYSIIVYVTWKLYKCTGWKENNEITNTDFNIKQNLCEKFLFTNKEGLGRRIGEARSFISIFKLSWRATLCKQCTGGVCELSASPPISYKLELTTFVNQRCILVKRYCVTDFNSNNEIFLFFL